MTLTEQARALLNDLAVHARNADRRASGEVARMARDAYRDHLADMAVLQRPTLRKLEGLCQ